MVTITEDAAIISAVAAILLAIFTVIELRHLEKHRNVDISMKLFEWAQEDRLRKAFRWLVRNSNLRNAKRLRLKGKLVLK